MFCVRKHVQQHKIFRHQKLFGTLYALHGMPLFTREKWQKYTLVCWWSHWNWYKYDITYSEMMDSFEFHPFRAFFGMNGNGYKSVTLEKHKLTQQQKLNKFAVDCICVSFNARRLLSVIPLWPCFIRFVPSSYIWFSLKQLLAGFAAECEQVDTISLSRLLVHCARVCVCV